MTGILSTPTYPPNHQKTQRDKRQSWPQWHLNSNYNNNNSFILIGMMKWGYITKMDEKPWNERRGPDEIMCNILNNGSAFQWQLWPTKEFYWAENSYQLSNDPSLSCRFSSAQDQMFSEGPITLGHTNLLWFLLRLFVIIMLVSSW